MIDLFKEIVKEYGNEKGIFIIIGFGIISYILKQILQMWINTAIEEVKANNNEKIENLKAKLEKNKQQIEYTYNEKIEKLKTQIEKQKQQIEHIHQVSQPTYQKLFEKKIDIYQHLIQILQKYKITWEKTKTPLEAEEDIFYQNKKLYFDEIEEIKEAIEGNQLYISNELVKIYDKLITKLDESYFIIEEEKFSILLNQSNMNGIEYEKYKEDKNQKIYNEAYKKIQSEYEEFDKILKDDILKIKDKINLD